MLNDFFYNRLILGCLTEVLLLTLVQQDLVLVSRPCRAILQPAGSLGMSRL